MTGFVSYPSSIPLPTQRKDMKSVVKDNLFTKLISKPYEGMPYEPSYCWVEDEGLKTGGRNQINFTQGDWRVKDDRLLI